MKVTILDQDYYSIYLSHAYSLINDFSNKELIGDYAKNIIVKLKKTYGIILNGYYQMKVFVNDKVGMFLELRKLDDIDFDLVSIDLNVIFFLKQPFLLKVSNFDYISNFSPIYFWQNYYYVSFDKIDDPLRYLEFGDIIYGEEVEEILRCSKIVKSCSVLGRKD